MKNITIIMKFLSLMFGFFDSKKTINLHNNSVSGNEDHQNLLCNIGSGQQRDRVGNQNQQPGLHHVQGK